MARKDQQRKKELQKNRKELNDLKFVSKNPVKYSLAIASLWVIILFAVSLIGFFMNKRGYLWNLNAASIVIAIISLIWVMIKIGVMESLLFKVRRHKDKSFSQKYKVKVSTITRKEYTEERESRSWIGIIGLAIFSVSIFIVTTIIQYI